MKTLYTSPVVTVEELTKVDILCASTEITSADTDYSGKRDNINQKSSTIGDLTRFL